MSLLLNSKDILEKYLGVVKTEKKILTVTCEKFDVISSKNDKLLFICNFIYTYVEKRSHKSEYIEFSCLWKGIVTMISIMFLLCCQNEKQIQFIYKLSENISS